MPEINNPVPLAPDTAAHLEWMTKTVINTIAVQMQVATKSLMDRMDTIESTASKRKCSLSILVIAEEPSTKEMCPAEATGRRLWSPHRGPAHQTQHATDAQLTPGYADEHRTTAPHNTTTHTRPGRTRMMSPTVLGATDTRGTAPQRR